MNNLPLARNKNIVVQNLAREILIYDLAEDRAFYLNETLALVYQACDGTTSFDKLKSKYSFNDDVIYLALDDLKRENLLEKNADYLSPFVGMSRREAIRKVGMASMIALPLISGLTAPTAANAASGVAVACTAPANTICLCPNGTVDSCGAGSTNFGFAQCQQNCTCVTPAICSSANGCTGTCR